MATTTPVTVHCFFQCGHTETGDPYATGRRMQGHYDAQHEADVERVLTAAGRR